MREGNPSLVRREDYLAPAYRIKTVDLTFDLDAAKTLVTSRLLVERNPAAQPGQPLELNGEAITLLRVQANGQSVSFRFEADLLVIDNPPAEAEFTLDIRNTCAPEKNTQLSGLYTSDSGLFTQCEAEGFRRITYFLDRPDVMAVYTVTLRANKALYPVLLSNGNLVEQGELETGPTGPRHFAKWHDPFPKPCYLFALVAADLVAREQWVRTRSGRDHLLQVHVKRGDLDKTEHAMKSLVASMVWDEARFHLPLDLERFMIVAVSDFNMGAMENKGLNIFNTKYVLASPSTATDDDFMAIESVVGHEYFHNWTGNRVTCRDWFQLSLKEGLTVFRDQEFSMDMAGGASARAVKRIEDVHNLRQLQFPEDAGPMAHPVRPERYEAIDNFYTATVYEKGSEVVRMMQTLVGRDGFARGLTLYFQRHDGQAVTCDDFAQAMADANPGSDLATRLDTFKRWYAQAGTPGLRARGHHDAATSRYTLTLEQRCAPTPGQATKEPFVIPVALGLLDRNGRALPLRLDADAVDAPALTERVLVLDQARADFVFTGIDAEPVPSLLRGFSAPVTLDDGLSAAELLTLLAHDGDPFNRWEAGQRLALTHLLASVRHDPSPDAASAAPPRLDEAFVDALRSLLRQPGLDPAFKSLVLSLPSEAYIAEHLSEVDPQRIHAARELCRRELAGRLHEDWIWAFEQHQVSAGYRPNSEQSGRRALANLALQMLVLDAGQSGDPVWPGRAWQRFQDAGNMTDRLGALTALVDAGSELSGPAIERFYALFERDALVVDKWFALQALAPEPLGADAGRVFERVKALMRHPAYSLANPNRARSLLVTLMKHNPAAFHRADGAGYQFWAEQVLEVDAINPQLASRLARTMDRWGRLAEPGRTAAARALQRVASHAGLSGDTREIVTRALEN